MRLGQKIAIYQKLVAGLSKGVHLAAVLGELGEAEDQERVEGKNEELAETAAQLRQQIQKQWNAQAKSTIDGIRDSSAKLQEQIRKIETTKETGQKVVKAIGYLDDLIELAAKVASKIV